MLCGQRFAQEERTHPFVAFVSHTSLLSVLRSLIFLESIGVCFACLHIVWVWCVCVFGNRGRNRVELYYLFALFYVHVCLPPTLPLHASIVPLCSFSSLKVVIKIKSKRSFRPHTSFKPIALLPCSVLFCSWLEWVKTHNITPHCS